VWLNKPISALDDDKPIELIAAGDYCAVARLISGPRRPGAPSEVVSDVSVIAVRGR
jgi:hypothetical protein